MSGIVQNGHLGGGGYLPRHYLSQFHPKYTSRAATDRLAAADGFTEPPKSLQDAMELYAQGLSADEEERVRIGRELYQPPVDQVWTIGVVGFGFAVTGISDRLRNVPARVINMKVPANAFPMTFYYEQ